MLWSDWPRAESMAPVMPAARRPQAPGRQADRQPRPDHPGRRSKRDHADHDPRDRGDHRRKDSGPHRADRPVPRPSPLRLLRRRRPDRSLLRAGPKAPAVQARQPPAQQCFARRRDHPATPPRPGPRLLREEDHRGQDHRRSTPSPQTTPRRPGLRHHRRRRAAEPERTSGGVYEIQRGWPNP